MSKKKDARLWSMESPENLSITYHYESKVVGRIWLDHKGKLNFAGELDDTCRNLYRALERMIELYPLNVGRVLGGKKEKEATFKI